MTSTVQRSFSSIPTLYYEDFGRHAVTRLNTLRGLSVLMSHPLGTYSAQSLGVTEDEWKALCSWLSNKDAAGEALYFWAARPYHKGLYRVTVSRHCTGHVLVGTSQMLRDLAETELIRPRESQAKESFGSYPANSSGLSSLSLNELWKAAQNYVSTEVAV